MPGRNFAGVAQRYLTYSHPLPNGSFAYLRAILGQAAPALIARLIVFVVRILRKKTPVTVVDANTKFSRIPIQPTITVAPCPGFTNEELLSAAASAEQFSKDPFSEAILLEATSLAVPLLPAEDIHHFEGRGKHCWVGNVPTLIGSREFLVRLGIEIANCPNAGCEEVYVAQGSRLLGKIQFFI